MHVSVRMPFFNVRRRNMRSFLHIGALFTFIFLLWQYRVRFGPADQKPASQGESGMQISLGEVNVDAVVATLRGDNTSWLFEYFPEWHKTIYVVDDPTAPLTVERNKGRESMVFLTYIIANYDHLPKYMLFLHPDRYQWHNDDPDYDGLPMLRRFRLAYLEKEGYVNIRCTWHLGCPDEIKPWKDTPRDAIHAGADYRKSFMELFPGQPVPQEIGVSCCAQFSVTREKVLERPKSDYEHYRQWLLRTPLKDALSGRVMEYSWHIIFGKEPVHCPSAKDCYCNVFGLCNLTCYSDYNCDGRYILPPFSTLPKGWPEVGWDGKPRKRLFSIQET